MIGTMMYLTAVLLGLVALYLVVVAGVGLLQHRLLYLPERASVEALLATGLQPWPSRDEVSGKGAAVAQKRRSERVKRSRKADEVTETEEAEVIETPAAEEVATPVVDAAPETEAAPKR